MRRNNSFVKSIDEEYLPSSSSRASENSNKIVFHRTMCSADGAGRSAPSR